ncbi:hypothetical protein [Plantibacter sp. YIM 135347]|uniref:hypothetical protein n=1 Tax=Plantibacter sp. YIM 135347 TaxID=3423919 RepID=UPI003D33C8D4
MIRETPVIEHLDIAYHDGQAWRTLAEKATQIVAQRGGKRSGVSNKISVGTLNVDLYGALDLEVEAVLRPNTPVRVSGRIGTPGAVLFNQPKPGTGTGWLQGLPAAFGTRVPLTANRPAKGTDPARVRVCHGIVSTTNWAVDGDSFLLFRTVALPPNRRFRVTARMTDWDVNLGQQYRLVASLGMPTGTLSIAGLARPQNQIAYTELPSIEFHTEEAKGPITASIGIGTTRNPSGASGSSDVLYGFDVDEFTIEMLPEDPPALFTGTILNLTQNDVLDKATGTTRTFSNISAVDNVAPLANTARYGAVVEGGAKFETWAARINRLAASSPVPVRRPPTFLEVLRYWWTGSVDGWAPLKQLITDTSLVPTNSMPPADVWPRREALALSYRSGSSPISAQPGTLGMERVITGLTPGSSYRITANAAAWPSSSPVDMSLRIGVAGLGVGSATTMPMLPSGTALSAYQFIATGTSHRVQVTNAAPILLPSPGALTWTVQEMQVVQTGVAEPYRLQDIVFESDLASHFDLACNSTGARWWVDSKNMVRFLTPDDKSAPIGLWTDNPAKVNDPGVFEYVGISTGFDTHGIVNALTLEQHGRKLDEDGDASADDYSTTFVSAPSVDRWGVRGDSLDTSLYTGQGFEYALDQRSGEVLAERANVARVITGFRWNAQESPTAALGLEVFKPVRVERGNLPQWSRVVGLKHTITPTRWMVDVDLTDIKAGVPFEDLNRALGARTFAQWSAALGSKSFARFNANPLEGLTP